MSVSFTNCLLAGARFGDLQGVSDSEATSPSEELTRTSSTTSGSWSSCEASVGASSGSSPSDSSPPSLGLDAAGTILALFFRLFPISILTFDVELMSSISRSFSESTGIW